MASERDASVDRIIAFSDGVVAIAITLLIFPLTDIEPAEGASLANVAADNAGALLGFALLALSRPLGAAPAVPRPDHRLPAHGLIWFIAGFAWRVYREESRRTGSKVVKQCEHPSR